MKMPNAKCQINTNKYQYKKSLDIRYWIFDIGYFRAMRGFTLVEMLLYMGIFIILLTVFIQLFSSLLSTQLSSQSTSGVSQDAKYLLARMAYDLSRSQNILSPAQGVSSSTLQFVVNGKTYTYTKSSGNLMLTSSTGSDRLNSSDTALSSLTFTPVGSSSGIYTVQVALTLHSITVSNGTTESQSIQTTLGNR